MSERFAPPPPPTPDSGPSRYEELGAKLGDHFEKSRNTPGKSILGTRTGTLTEQMRATGVFKGEKVGPLSDAELNDIVGARASWEMPDDNGGSGRGGEGSPDTGGAGGRRLLVEVPDSNDPNGVRALTNEEWDQKKANAGATGRPSLAEQGQQYKQEQADFETWQQELDKGLVDSLDPNVRAVGEALHGADVSTLASIIRGHGGEGEAPDTDNHQNAAPSFVHAGTGEKMSLADVKASLAGAAEKGSEAGTSPDGVALIGEYAATVLHALPHIDTGYDANGETYVVEEGKLDKGTGYEIVYNSDGGVEEVQISVQDEPNSEPGADRRPETHSVGVVEPGPNHGADVLIDGVSVGGNPEHLAVAQSVIEHVAMEAEQEVKAQAAVGQGAQPEATPDSGSGNGNTGKEAASPAEPSPVEAPGSQASTTEGAAPESSRIATTERQRPVDEAPAGYAGNFIRAYMQTEGARKIIVDSLKGRGVDGNALMKRLEGSPVPQGLAQRLQKLAQEARPNSSIWGEKTGPSALGKAHQVYAKELASCIDAILVAYPEAPTQ